MVTPVGIRGKIKINHDRDVHCEFILDLLAGMHTPYMANDPEDQVLCLPVAMLFTLLHLLSFKILKKVKIDPP
jgi:hypothetical protein